MELIGEAKQRITLQPHSPLFGRERESYATIFGQIMCNYTYITNKDGIHILPLINMNNII
jgi:hypothetical protein